MWLVYIGLFFFFLNKLLGYEYHLLFDLLMLHIMYYFIVVQTLLHALFNLSMMIPILLKKIQI